MSRQCFKRLFLTCGLLIALGTAAPSAAKPATHGGPPPVWTVEDLFASPSPYALGHRGYGANDGEDPTRPLANTLDAFHRAFDEGIRVVELDLQKTADGKIVVFHDDFLSDYTCVSALTYDELLARKPDVPLFRAVLNSSRHFSRKGSLSGILFAEIKVPVPLCDGSNTSEQAAVTEGALVAAVIADIRQARMEDQVILNSGSPSILKQVALQAPEIRRALTLNVLQLLPPEVVSDILDMPVVLIPKNDFGLAWYNIGVIARLPAIPSVPQFVDLSLAVGSRAVSLDKLVLLQAGAGAPSLVAMLHGAGLEAIAWTVDTAQEWAFMAQAGVDGITTNNIALGLANQAPLPALAALRLAGDGSQPAADAGDLAALDGMAARRLSLYPPRSNPSRDGNVQIEFSLPDGGPAELGLMDVTGRMVSSREVGSYGPGRHVSVLGQGLPTGMYFVRLSHAQGVAMLKVAVVR